MCKLASIIIILNVEGLNKIEFFSTTLRKYININIAQLYTKLYAFQILLRMHSQKSGRRNQRQKLR
jgi:hypothetical protein